MIQGTPLQMVTTFKYLGCIMTANISNWPALFTNLQKARKKPTTLACILTKTGLPPRLASLFYKAVAQAILLYSSEITPTMLQALKGFHHQVARQLTDGMPRKLANDQ